MAKCTQKKIRHLREPQPLVLAIEDIQPEDGLAKIVEKGGRYQMIRDDVCEVLKEKEAGVVECDLIVWCLEQVEDQIQDEQEVLEWQTQLQAVICDMIKTGDIEVRQTSASPYPEDRVLAIPKWAQRSSRAF